MPDQYAFINPGDKLYVLVHGVNGGEYIRVVEITFPTVERNGETIIDPSKPALEYDPNYDVLDEQDQFNLAEDGKPLLDAYAEAHKADREEA